MMRLLKETAKRDRKHVFIYLATTGIVLEGELYRNDMMFHSPGRDPISLEDLHPCLVSEQEIPSHIAAAMLQDMCGDPS